jgi:hypothetical protein
MKNLPTDPDALVDEEFVATYYGVTTRTIKLWRYEGRGPEYVRIAANQIRYRWGALLDFNRQRSAMSTSAETAAA